MGEYVEVVKLLEPLQPQYRENEQLALLLAACLTQRNESAKVVTVLSPFQQRNLKDRAVAFLLGKALLNEGLNPDLP